MSTLLSEPHTPEKWQQLQEQSVVFGSANLRTFPVSLSMLEQRSGLTASSLNLLDSAESGVVNLDDFKYATLAVTAGCTILGVASLALLPPNIGATVCYLLVLIPILFLGIGSTAPAVIANAIAALKKIGKNNKSSDNGNNKHNEGTLRERMVRHEAAHFCCGYWCGLPIRDYSTAENNVACVEFAVSPSNTQQQQQQQYSPTQVAALTVTALAGLVGEAKQWPKASAGAADDLWQLQNAVLGRSSEFLGAAQQQDLTRWGALTASLLLKQNAVAYEKVVEAFGRQAPLEECIALLEE